MEFRYDEVLDFWITELQFLGHNIKIRLYCGDDDDMRRYATKAANDVESHWGPMKSAMISELLPQYNDNAEKQLEGDEFFSKLILETIDFDARDIMYTLYWADSGLFGGHGIQVLWDPEEDFSADVSLVG